MLPLLLLLAAGVWGEGEHKQEAASLVAPAAPRTNYPEQPYYDYADAYPETNFQSQAADRQGEALIAAPMIITAFSAALFGGLLSPAITYGFERMSEYEIKWPEFTRKKNGKSRGLDFSWLETLEAVGKVVERIQKTQSTQDFQDYTR